MLHQTRPSLVQTLAPWVAAILVLLLLPQIFPSNSAIIILNQMAITIVFALSYNMLLGQAGLLSFGHSVYMGVGGFACIHVMRAVVDGDWAIPLPLLPLLAGLFSMGIATIIGGFSARRAGTVFAMISLGIIELVASLSIIIGVFFGYGGMGSDRTYGPSVFGSNFVQQTEVYYLVSFWLILAAAAMFFFTRTPLGRMANAVRDNADRAEYLGYSATWVRFCSFCAAGFFAGVAGGLSAVSFEIASAESLSLETSGTILLITFLGGTGHFYGPILGAILFTLLRTVLSFETDLWQLYLGILFLATVMFFPSGLAGLLTLHAPAVRSGNLTRLAAPYAKTLLPAALAIIGAAGLMELVFFVRTAPVGETTLTLFWTPMTATSPIPWLTFAIFLIAGTLMARRNAPALRTAWDAAQTPRSMKAP